MAVVVVTGASRGIGRETSRQLIDLGYTVVAGARDPSDVDVDGAHPVKLDVTSDADVSAAAKYVQDEFGGAAVLVNNAGVTYGDFQTALDPTIDLGEARKLMDVNLYGAWRMATAFAPQLRAADHARLVNVSSSFGTMADPQPEAGPYKVTKAALNMLTTIVAKELEKDGVLVNAICPGWVRTDMSGPAAPRSVEEGAGSVVWAVTIPDDGPTGGFFQDGKPLPW